MLNFFSIIAKRVKKGIRVKKFKGLGKKRKDRARQKPEL